MRFYARRRGAGAARALPRRSPAAKFALEGRAGGARPDGRAVARAHAHVVRACVGAPDGGVIGGVTARSSRSRSRAAPTSRRSGGRSTSAWAGSRSPRGVARRDARLPERAAADAPSRATRARRRRGGAGRGRPVASTSTPMPARGRRRTAPRAVVVPRPTRTGRRSRGTCCGRASRPTCVVFLDADVGARPRCDRTSCSMRSRRAAVGRARVAEDDVRAARPTLRGASWRRRTASTSRTSPASSTPRASRALPARMPEDLIEPERWLELEVGRDAHGPRAGAPRRRAAAGDAPRLLSPAHPDRDGKVQLEREYPGSRAAGTRSRGCARRS